MLNKEIIQLIKEGSYEEEQRYSVLRNGMTEVNYLTEDGFFEEQEDLFLEGVAYKNIYVDRIRIEMAQWFYAISNWMESLQTGIKTVRLFNEEGLVVGTGYELFDEIKGGDCFIIDYEILGLDNRLLIGDGTTESLSEGPWEWSIYVDDKYPIKFSGHHIGKLAVKITNGLTQYNLFKTLSGKYVCTKAELSLEGDRQNVWAGFAQDSSEVINFFNNPRASSFLLELEKERSLLE